MVPDIEWYRPRFANSIYTARYGRYILVRQVTSTRTARYRVVPPKNRPSAIDFNHRRSIEGEIDRRRSIEGEKGKKKKKKRRRGEEEPTFHVTSSPAHRRRPRPSPCAGRKIETTGIHYVPGTGTIPVPRQSRYTDTDR
ncbi:hypothetical protein GW17_00008385 [Ensete ventricosum]|nr:hypothetical protein GW17_00008385 [Ensete ventricosum]